MADSSGRYDTVILGGGSGGHACALRATELGKRVALIERDKVGGTCLHRGRIPTKALLHAAEIADHANEAESFGVRARFDGIDMAGVNAYKDKVVNRLWKGLQSTIASRKVDVVYGEGRLLSPTSVGVGGDVYEGDHVVLATGSQPKNLPGLAIDGQRVISSDHALTLDRVPGSVVILGGGVIGVEFASLWRSFGAEVTIVEMLPTCFRPRRSRARSCWSGRSAAAASPTSSGPGSRASRRAPRGSRSRWRAARPSTPSCCWWQWGAPRCRPTSATRPPASPWTAGSCRWTGYCRTSVPTISAVGDLTPGLQLAHLGFAEGILAAERVSGLPITPIDYDGVPRITYSDPEVASVGITSATAAQRGIETTEFTYNLGGNGKSVILQTQGAAKIIAAVGEDGRPGPVLGVHLVGARAGEVIAEGQLIYNWETLPSEVAQLIHPHPTLSEAIGEAHLALAGKPLHVHA